MSNDLILSIKNRLANLPAGVDDDTRAVAGAGGGGGNKRISIKGGVFRKIVNGKEVGNIEDRHMNVIFVKMSHDPARTFYSQGYQDGAKVSPVCWSSNSKTPDPEVKKPQASTCDTCPHSVKGSGQGGMGTACRLQWRTAVVLPDNPGGDVLQLVLPATSCFGKEQGGRWPFRPYIQTLASANLSARRIITKMQFDTKSPVPKLVFSPVDAVSPEDEEIIRQQADSVEAENAIKLTVFQSDEGEAAAPAEAPAPVAAAPAEDGSEPTLRPAKKPDAPATDAQSVLNKWKKK